jgi:hypothetical protein
MLGWSPQYVGIIVAQDELAVTSDSIERVLT